MALIEMQSWLMSHGVDDDNLHTSVNAYVDNSLSDRSMWEQEEQCVKDRLESLVAAQEEFQKAWRHAEAHSPNLPEVSPIEASAAKKGLELSRTHACAEKTKIVRCLKALLRGRMGQGRFDFGSFPTGQGDQSASKGEITTLVVDGVSQTHDEATLRAKLDNRRGCVCTERYMDMIAARFHKDDLSG